MVKIIKDIPLIRDVFKYDVILIGVSTYCTMGNGFAHDIKINFPFVNKANIETPYADLRKLGTINIVKFTPTMVLCYITHSNNFRPDLVKEYVDYDALSKCLININKKFKGKRVATTLIGGSKFDGNGDRDKILNIIEENCKNIELYVYDYLQEDYRAIHNRRWQELIESLPNITKEEYYKRKKEILWERKHGIWNPPSESN